MPEILMGIFLEKDTPFLEEFFGRIAALIYPKDRIHLFVHNNVSELDLILQ